MSINITVHGSPINSGKLKNILIDNDRARKEEFEKRRKLRLEQVRQKSKEIASELRRNVESEKRKQLEKIDKIKKDELLQWRKKVAAEVENEYKNALNELGTAHKAAEEQQEKLIPCEGNKRWLRPDENKSPRPLPRRLQSQPTPSSTGKSTKGGKIISNNMKKYPIKTPASIQKKHEHIKQKKQSLNENDENSSNVVNVKLKKTPKDTEKTVKSTEINKFSPKAKRKADEISSISSSESIPKSPEKKKYAKTPPVVIEIDSESDSSLSLDIEDTHNLSNMQFSRIRSNHSPVLSSPTVISKTRTTRSRSKKRNDKNRFIDSIISKPTEEKHFTQISDLIRQKSLGDEQFAPRLPRDSQGKSMRTIFDERKQVTRSTSVSPKRCTRSPTKSPEKVIRSTPSSPKKQLKDAATDTRSMISSKQFILSSNSGTYRKQCENISTKSSLKPSDSTSQQQQRQQTQGNRVKFYDYNNKFEKQYEPPHIVQSETTRYGLDAMEKARIEAELEECRQKELEKLKSKSDERCQIALERERIRRDCEALTQKLDAISKENDIQNRLSKDAYLFSSVRINNAEEKKQKKLHSKIESILNRPCIITCPEIRGKDDDNVRIMKNVDPKPKKKLPDLNIGVAMGKDKINTVDDADLNLSDSCQSILLNHVSNQTKKVSEDIANCNDAQNLKRLQSLLDKINNLRDKLMDKMKTQNSEPYSKKDFQDDLNYMDMVQKEREEILTKGKKQKTELKDGEIDKSKKDEIEKREQELKRREQIFEKKLKDFYKTSKPVEKEKTQKKETEKTKEIQSSESTDAGSESEILASKNIVSEKPIEIVIKVKNQSPRTPFKSPRKRASLANLSAKRKKKDHIRKLLSTVQQKPNQIKSPQKSIPLYVPQRHEGSSMTSYQSPPSEIKTPLTHLLDRKKYDSKDLKDDKMEAPKPINIPKIVPTIDRRLLANPQLKHYIQRLLGMSHHAIEMLGVSTSEMETPSSSIINNSANISSTESESFEKNKIQRLKKFIQDNYTFLNEVDESMQKSISSLSSNFSDAKPIERVWKQALMQKKQEDKQDTKTKIKPILKKIKSPKKSTPKEIAKNQEKEKSKSTPVTKAPATTTSENILKPPDRKIPQSSGHHEGASSKKLELLDRYNGLAENCTQRIAELNEMINRVREEKQKILEITLSSGGDTVRTSTEYADFGESNANVDRSGSSKSSDKRIITSNVPQSPEKIPLEKNKLTGISRDSGISLSRPVTALGSHESPEISSSVQEEFEPILKDIPKPSAITPHVQITPPSFQLPPNIQVVHMISAGTKLRKEKPPVSLGRFSPQFGEQLQPPHELSTIVEVDTPVTSRLNTSVTDKQEKQIVEDNDLETEKIKDDIPYQKFPSFEEYVKQNNLDLSKFDPEAISQIQIEYDDLISRMEKSKNNDDTQEISNLSKEAKNLVESLRLVNLSFKKFPTRKEYLEQMGISDPMDLKSIEMTGLSDITAKDQSKDSSDEKTNSIESLLDVVKELRRRNMLKDSFQNEVQDNSNKDIPSEDDSGHEITVSSSTDYDQKPSKIKKLKKSPTKKKTQQKQKQQELSDLNDILSGIEMIPSTGSSQSDKLEKDLENIGLTWAAAMIKKSNEKRRELDSTSSSVSHHHNRDRRDHDRPSSLSKNKLTDEARLQEMSKTIKQEFSDITDESIGLDKGRPLNLREFLAKQLQKRSSSNLSSDSDSITSQFLKSLLGSSGSRSLSGKRSNQDLKNLTDRVKTSTPINARYSSKSSSTSHHHSSSSQSPTKFFHDDSRPSSVRYNSKENNNDNDDDDNRNLYTNSDNNNLKDNLKKPKSS